ncbi:hypothetical protein EBGED10_3580 [Bacillus sp. GeD10]|nr:hypothetical protein EBGED10_3580 [Bacillus sp. GeD10]
MRYNKPHLRTIWDQQWVGPPSHSDNMISKIQHNKKVAELEKEVQRTHQ